MSLVSLGLNIVVLVPVCLGIARNAGWAQACFGAPSPARGILLALYGTILLLSAGLLVFSDRHALAVLLLVQVIYKLGTPFTVGTLRNAVVQSNLAIAAVHVVTLVTILEAQIVAL